MNREEIFETIRASVIDQLGVDEGEVTEEASFSDDLDADSLDRVELVMALEDTFGIKIPDEEANELLTVGDAVNFVEEHI